MSSQEKGKVNYQRFEPSLRGDYDEAIYSRSFSGRMTKGRYKIIERFCRINSGRIPVYSDYDCTGKVCGRYFEFNYKNNQVNIELRVVYDV